MKIFTGLLVLCASVGLFSCSKGNLTDEFNTKMQNASCAELGSVECRISKVIKADDNASWYKFGDRKILFECKGTIKAGVDLSEKDSYTDVIDEKTNAITLTLPAPKVLALNMDPEETKLVYEKVSATRFDFSSVERTDLLRQGEQSIKEDLGKTGILEEAEKNSTLFFTAMLSQLGFKQITINYKKG
ncbi:MAG: DUF4230 domain-containing protein [Bacteroidales bacterium]|nr:DUF4230 domain-containing protein [Candidatus Physcocola equi]